MSITTYENVMECRFKDVHKTNTVKLCEVNFELLLQNRFGKITDIKRIKEELRSQLSLWSFLFI